MPSSRAEPGDILQRPADRFNGAVNAEQAAKPIACIRNVRPGSRRRTGRVRLHRLCTVGTRDEDNMKLRGHSLEPGHLAFPEGEKLVEQLISIRVRCAHHRREVHGDEFGLR